MASPASYDARLLEHEFEAHREAVLAMLAAEFPRLPDHEDLYQEAWAEALEHWSNGAQITHVRAFLKLIAWRRARDAARNRAAVTSDPTGALLSTQADVGPGPEEIAAVAVDAAVVRCVIDELDPRQAAVIKMRFDLGMSSKQMQEVLGVSAKRLEKLVTKAYSTVAQQLTVDAAGESPWSRRQRSLLVACLTDLASPRQQARARRLLAEDPACRAMLAQLRATLEHVAVALPLPVLAETQAERTVPVVDRLHDGAAALRDLLGSGAARAAGQPTVLEPMTGGVAGMGAAGAAKVVLVCLSLGGGAAVCVQIGVLGRDPKPEKVPAVAIERPPAKEERVARVLPPPPKPKATVRRSQPKRTTTTAAAPRPRTNGPAAPSPVPPGSTEFGPGTVGSTAASTQPAAAPADGGGEFTP